MRNICLAPIALCTLLLSQISCGTHDKTDTGFDRQVNLAHTVLNDNLIVGFPSMMETTDSALIICASQMPDGILRLYSLETYTELGRGVPVGRGPQELLSAQITGKSKDGKYIQIYDLLTRKVGWFSAQKLNDRDSMVVVHKPIVELVREPDELGWYQKVCSLGDSNYVALYAQSDDKFYALLDRNTNFSSYFGHAPIPEKTSDYSTSLQGLLRSDGDVAVFAPFDFNYVCCIAMEGSTPKIIWEDRFAPAHYKVTGQSISFIKDKTAGRMQGLAISKEYIYVLWWSGLRFDFRGVSEKDYANIIFVYTRDGRRVARLNLDKPIYQMCLSPDQQTIYGLAQTPQDILVSYDIPKLD